MGHCFHNNSAWHWDPPCIKVIVQFRFIHFKYQIKPVSVIQLMKIDISQVKCTLSKVIQLESIKKSLLHLIDYTRWSQRTNLEQVSDHKGPLYFQFMVTKDHFCSYSWSQETTSLTSWSQGTIFAAVYGHKGPLSLMFMVTKDHFFHFCSHKGPLGFLMIPQT